MSAHRLTYTSFAGHRRIAHGTLLDNTLAVWRAQKNPDEGPVLLFSDATGQVVDVDTRGSEMDVAERHAFGSEFAPSGQAPDELVEDEAPRRRGRPRLGVIAREVTLLPRHWEWLAAQPGGASVTLRKLVEEARRSGAPKEQARHAQERAYHFMSALAGDLQGFEEATRALFANDDARMRECMESWPPDIRAHALFLSSIDLKVYG